MAAFFATWWLATSVQESLKDPNIELWAYPSVKAYTTRHRYLHMLEVPQGFISSTAPPSDMLVAATKASLIIHEDLPLTMQYRLLNAIREVHAKPNVQLGNDTFPSGDISGSVRLSIVAEEYYSDPNSNFFKFNSFVADLRLPLWINERILQALHSMPLRYAIGVGIIPLLYRLMLSFFNWLRERPVFKMLVEVMRLEAEAEEAIRDASRKRVGDISLQLEGLMKQASERLRRRVVSILTATLLMLLRLHINALRRRLQPYLSEHGPEKKAAGNSQTAALT